MADLKAVFVDAGCEEVRTYIQSGNVVFRSTRALARRIPNTVTQAVSDRFGFTVPVVTRAVDELRAVRDSNPFLVAGEDPTKLHVAFLANKPAKGEIAALDPDRSPPDEFAVRGHEIFLFCPNGMARTKLTNAYLDSKLMTMSTVRNWNTVLKLVSLAEEL